MTQKKISVIFREIPDKYFEIIGVLVGCLASLCIAAQVRAECLTNSPSTVSLTYASGFLVMYTFWILYGIRFRRPAIWTINGVAVFFQALLLAVILIK